jgi:hypothetical protein
MSFHPYISIQNVLLIMGFILAKRTHCVRSNPYIVFVHFEPICDLSPHLLSKILQPKSVEYHPSYKSYIKAESEVAK